MKDDLISRQAAIEALCDICPALKMNGRCMFGDSQDCEDIKCLMSLPPAEPERKQGEWIRQYSKPNVYADLFWHCSQCGFKNEKHDANVYHKFCPNCGAEMTNGIQRSDKSETD